MPLPPLQRPTLRYYSALSRMLLLLLRQWLPVLVLLLLGCRRSDGSRWGPASVWENGSSSRQSQRTLLVSTFGFIGTVPPSTRTTRTAECGGRKRMNPSSSHHRPRATPGALDSTPRQSSWACRNSRNGSRSSTTTTTTAMFVQSRRAERNAGAPTSRREEEEVVEYDDDDDDDDDSGVEILPYRHYLQELQNLAAQTSRDGTAAVDQAMRVVDRMFRAYVNSEDDAIFPDTEIYNALLNVHAFAKVGPNEKMQESTVVAAAESIVARMEDPAFVTAPPPNAETYATLLDMYMQRQDYDPVFQLVQQIQASAKEPYCSSHDIVILNKLIQAHGRRGNCDDARQVLNDMLNNNNNNNNAVKPNDKTWVQVMRAYAARGDANAVRELITDHRRRRDDDNNNEDEDEAAAPASTAMWNALLQAYAVQGNATAAEQVLYQMLESSSSAESSGASPDAKSFEYVLQAYHRQKPRPGVVFKVEQCLALRDALAKEKQKRDDDNNNNNNNNNDWSDDDAAAWKLLSANTLYHAVAAMQRDTQDPLKLVKSARLLQERQSDTADAHAPPHVYRNLLYACAHYKVPKKNNGLADQQQQHQLATFQVALDAFNQLVRQRDSRVYGQLMRTAGRLLPPGNKRDAVIGKIFDQCCAAGYVNEYVLEMLNKAASDQLLLRTLGGFLEDGVTVPDKWSRNVEVAKDDKPEL